MSVLVSLCLRNQRNLGVLGWIGLGGNGELICDLCLLYGVRAPVDKL